MVVGAWRGLNAWLAEIDRQLELMRPSTPLYGRFDTTARLLTVERLRASTDGIALCGVCERLDAARRPMGHQLHDLSRVWSRAELGALLVEARNRRQLLAMGRSAPKPKGPRLDPTCLPADRLDALIETHGDLRVVEGLKAERTRRRECGGREGEGRRECA